MKPKIRFRGFSGKWEETSLGKLVNVYDGVHQTPRYTDKGIMFLSVENISTLKSNKFINEVDFNQFYKIYPEKGDILMTRIGDVGTPNVIEVSDKIAYYVSLALLKPIAINPYYLSACIQSPTFQHNLKLRTLTTAIPQKINKDEIGKVECIYSPYKDERQAIASYFQGLDALIRSTIKKIESLKQVKAASLLSMFPQEGETKPRVRFKGFEGEWEKIRFGNLYERSIIKNDLTYGTDKIISVANMYFIKTEKSIDEDYLKSYNVMRLGDIAFEGNKSKHFAHGRFVENTIGDGIVSHVFIVLRPISKKYDINFWKYYINNENIMGDILVRSTKSSTMMTDLVVNDFLNESILVPSYEEQIQIGQFLSSLDSQITLQAQRLEKLKQIKSACLDNMFV